MSNPIIAIQITKKTLPMITMLNDGVEPWISAENDYYLFEIDSPNTTTEHQILSEKNFRALQATSDQITVFEVKQ